MKIKDIVIPNANNGPNESWEFINYVDTGSCTKNEISHIQKIKRGFYPSRAKRIVNKNDIIISTVRPNQCHYAIIKEPLENMVVSTGFTVLTPKENVIPEYLYFFLTQETITKRLSILAEGATTSYPSITPDDILDIEINLPDLDYQKLVVDVLWPIEEKIILIKKINTELENLAKTIYNYWFVQFDFPNNEGKPYKSSGGEMEWNEELKMEIPKGWKTKSLYDIAIYTNGLAMQKHRPNGDEKLPVIKIKEMNEGYSAATEYARPDIEDAYLIREGDVLFSWSASLNVMIWADKVGALNQHIFKVTSEFYPRYYFYHQISNYLNHFKLMAENRKTTMGHITIDHLKESRIVVPDDDSLILKCGERIEPILDLIVKNRMTNIDLMEVRDFLLPMLMNGQVKVKSEAKEQLSIAAEPQVKYGK